MKQPFSDPVDALLPLPLPLPFPGEDDRPRSLPFVPPASAFSAACCLMLSKSGVMPAPFIWPLKPEICLSL
jgi:hypothetical protein